jgi:predicted O-linked N-acetylglucosamine transferase (SPINDLY family)
MVTIPEALAIGIKHHQAGDLRQAEHIYRQILATNPDHGEALHYLGLLASQTGHLPAAVDYIGRAIALNPSKSLWHYNLGQALQSLGRLDEAAACYRQTLRINPHDAEAYHNLGRILHTQGKLDESVAFYLQSLRINPRDAETHNNLGNVLQSQGKLDEAAACYQQALSLNPHFVEVRCNLGNTLEAQGKLDEAVACYEQALQIKPQYAEAYYNLGNAKRTQEKLDEAVACYEQAIAIKPDHIQTRHNLGGTLHTQGKLDEAVACYREALQLDPQQAELHNSLGTALQAQGKLDEAAGCFRQALQINPADVKFHTNLGIALQAFGKLDEAVASYRNGLEVSPDNADAHNNLGTALQVQGKLNAAVDCFRRALQLEPNKAEAHFNLGTVLQERRKLDEAAGCFRRALEISPDLSEARSNLAHGLQHLCSWKELDVLAQRIIEDVAANDDHHPVHSIPPFAFLSLATPTSAELQCRCARQWVQHRLSPMMDLARTLRFDHIASTSDRIRVGYLSTDFRAHPVGLAICELLESHDHSRFEVTGYSLGPDDTSHTRQRIIKAFHRFVDVSGESFVQSAKRIHSDRIDILVDLMGYTGRARTAVLALRPAPIQLLYLGYPGTMGAPFVDYLVADEFVVPREQEANYAEKIVRLPRCFFPADSQRAIAPGPTSRSACDLPENGLVFCCFNNSYKITPRQFAVWMRLLHAIPGSVLWFSVRHQVVKENLRAAAADQGIAAERLVFAPKLPSLADHLARYRVADLFLDTFPFNAHSTASDALWGGCPVLTLAGDTFASRVAGSLLRAAGLPELVTNSIAEYEEKALALVHNPERLVELRARLEKNRLECGLFDGKLRARELERAFLAVYERHRAGLPPEAIDVADIG